MVLVAPVRSDPRLFVGGPVGSKVFKVLLVIFPSEVFRNFLVLVRSEIFINFPVLVRSGPRFLIFLGPEPTGFDPFIPGQNQKST